jgi:xanthine dehydrogenase accessory factor
MDIYPEIVAALSEDGVATLATVISSSGSTPVSQGAKMLIRKGNPHPLGSVGGGSVEAAILATTQVFPVEAGQCLIRDFTLSEEDTRSGMVCGGTMNILVEPVSQEQGTIYLELLSRREAGRDCALITRIDLNNTMLGKTLVSPHGGGIDEEDLSSLHGITPDFPDSFVKILCGAITRQEVTRITAVGGEFIIEPVAGVQDLIMFGGGHVSRYVSRTCAMAGFRVTIIDERPDYANSARFPEAYRTLAVSFDTSWSHLQIKPSTSIVIVTSGHKSDEAILERAIDTPARYIGMIGSKQKVLATFSDLESRGVPRENLRRIHAPMGLDIGAETAEEIGVSIAAELIAARRKSVSGGGAMSERVAEFFQTGNADPGLH